MLQARAMSQYQSQLLRLLDERGYIHQLTDAQGLDALSARDVVPGYIGFDPTAPSLHVGSLVQIMMLRRMQQAGHKPIVLMGGGTGKIGDPSLRDEARSLLTVDKCAGALAAWSSPLWCLNSVFSKMEAKSEFRPPTFPRWAARWEQTKQTVVS